MAVNVQARGSRHQLRVMHGLLPRAFFARFETEREARDYGDQLHAMLDRGVVPQELVAAAPKGDDPLLMEVIRQYTKAAPITASDDALLSQMMPELVGTRISTITYLWIDRYVRDLKLKRSKPIAPSTIRKRIGVLGRVLDWYWWRVTPQDKLPPANPMRLLPRGYSLYGQGEANELSKFDKVAKCDQVRNRRLEPGEEDRILAALAGTKRRDRERALDADPAFKMLFRLIVATDGKSHLGRPPARIDHRCSIAQQWPSGPLPRTDHCLRNRRRRCLRATHQGADSDQPSSELGALAGVGVGRNIGGVGERETTAFFAHSTNFRVDAATRTVWLSEILDFYPEDFVPMSASSLLAYANRYAPEPAPPDVK